MGCAGVAVYPGDVPDAARPNASTLNPITPVAFNFWQTGVGESGANAGTIAVKPHTVPLANVEAIWARPDPPGERTVLVP